MYKEFQINPLLKSMNYAAEQLTIVFNKKSGGTETREYIGVPQWVAYEWYYKSTLKETLSYYAKNIRKKFTLTKITKQTI